jgi:hypothetical protein
VSFHIYQVESILVTFNEKHKILGGNRSLKNIQFVMVISVENVN